MKLLELTASVCCKFSQARNNSMRTVQKVKENQARDVVTTLDESLHRLTEDFVKTTLPACKLMSEEGEAFTDGNVILREGEWLVVDPLDGSNNFALSLPGYGYMATHISKSKIIGSLVVLPEHDLYIIFEENRLITSQILPKSVGSPSGSAYYAYPPKLTEAACQARTQLISLIDNYFAGTYRYGSSCVGLYNLVCGKHTAFIGHNIRIWDALAYFPILRMLGIEFRYHISGTSLVLIASFSEEFINDASSIISEQEQLELHKLTDDQTLVITS